MISNIQSILALLESKNPKDQQQLCVELKILFQPGKLISDEERDTLDETIRMFIQSHRLDLNPSYPMLQFLGFWQGKDDKEILALFLDPFLYFIPPSYGRHTAVFEKRTIQRQLRLPLGSGRMSANWEEAIRQWPKN